MLKEKLKALTPNIMVADVAKTVDFYSENLGFQLYNSIPLSEETEGKYVWALIGNGDVLIMLHEENDIKNEYPQLSTKPLGAALTFFIEVDDVDALYASIKGKVNVIKELDTKFYGMREFAIEDCNDYILTFAQKIS